MNDADRIVRSLNRNAEIAALGTLLRGAFACVECGRIATQSHLMSRPVEESVQGHSEGPLGSFCDGCSTAISVRYAKCLAPVKAISAFRDYWTRPLVARLEALLKNEA